MQDLDSFRGALLWAKLRLRTQKSVQDILKDFAPVERVFILLEMLSTPIKVTKEQQIEAIVAGNPDFSLEDVATLVYGACTKKEMKLLRDRLRAIKRKQGAKAK